mmetsp:Transcript_32241/g.49342  ORF Transcript_32241/g.49342 Transcript_32241/m.49342 type:complete len:81 (-) Transcript_32241:977-1219(-)
MKKLQDELTKIEGEMIDKDQELLQQETSMLSLTEELSKLKEKLEEYQTGGDSKVQRINELQLEMQELTEQYEHNKKDLYE